MQDNPKGTQLDFFQDDGLRDDRNGPIPQLDFAILKFVSESDQFLVEDSLVGSLRICETQLEGSEGGGDLGFATFQLGMELPRDRLGGDVPTVVFCGLQPFGERLQLRKVTPVAKSGMVAYL